MNPKVKERLDSISRFSDKPLADYTHLVTTNMCMLTGSTISYFATMNDKQDVLTMIGWSKSAMSNCAMIEKPIVYKLSETGLWGDAVREKDVVITNDYKGLEKPTKKGYPKGHVDVRRHMNLPVFESGKVALVAGVGNKPTDYTPDDAECLKDFMSEVWKVLKPKL